jgi:hypothetical protein
MYLPEDRIQDTQACLLTYSLSLSDLIDCDASLGVYCITGTVRVCSDG